MSIRLSRYLIGALLLSLGATALASSPSAKSDSPAAASLNGLQAEGGSAPRPLAGPGDAPSRPRPIMGWDPAYDSHVRTEVQKAPALLELTPQRMTILCPKWGAMSRDQRIQFYADLLYAVALPESGRDRRVMYNETGIIDPKTKKQTIDAVTGYPIISEGLLQLSYTDSKNYPPENDLACAFDWARDKEAFIKDLQANAGKKSFKSASQERTILDPYVQLSCGLHIMDRLVRKSADKDFLSVTGRYWSTLRPASDGYKQVTREIKARKSPCF